MLDRLVALSLVVPLLALVPAAHASRRISRGSQASTIMPTLMMLSCLSLATLVRLNPPGLAPCARASSQVQSPCVHEFADVRARSTLHGADHRRQAKSST